MKLVEELSVTLMLLTFFSGITTLLSLLLVAQIINFLKKFGKQINLVFDNKKTQSEDREDDKDVQK